MTMSEDSKTLLFLAIAFVSAIFAFAVSREAPEKTAADEVGKPLVIEEIFPLKCSLEELDVFIKKSRAYTDGWISFYWGKTIKEYEKDADISGALMTQWLRYFQENSLAK